MESQTNSNKENSIEEQLFPNFDININKIFCPLCFQFPEYYIKFLSPFCFILEHACFDGKIIESSIDLEKNSEAFTFNCSYCKKECNNICIKCKYVLCEDCSKEHIKIPYAITEEISEDLLSEKNSVYNIINSQYICDKHLLEYKHFCPFCKVNMCLKCQDEHFHINCPALLGKELKMKDIKEPSDECFKKLFILAKIFYFCYNKNYSLGKMTLNILLNTNLADNILTFIQENSPKEGFEIKNNYINSFDENIFLCKEFKDYSHSEFERYHNNLIQKAYTGKIYEYHLLNEIIEKYEIKYGRKIYPKFLLKQFYERSLIFQKENLFNKINLIKIEFNLTETNIILADCLRMINSLKLRNKFLEFSLQLVKMISLQMNYKLDFELRRKAGNIIAKILMKNFYKNLEHFETTKKLLALPSEGSEQRMNQRTQVKKNKNKKDKGPILSPMKSKYRKCLNMLYDKVNKEIEIIDNKDSINLKKEKINIILFKNRNNDPEEIKNAIICNLFFDIKWKLEDEFNNHIRNISHSIISLLDNEIKQLENSDNEDEDLDDSTITKEEIKDDLSIKEKIPSENKNIIYDTLCPKKYAFIEKLKNDIQVNKKDVKKFEEILQTDENDFIIPSNVDEFFKALKDIEISYDTLPSIKIEDSLDLYLNGKKGKILKKNLPDQNIKKIIKGYDKLSKEDKNEIIKIKNFCDKIKDQIENVSISLCYFMDNIIDEIEKISQFFDIKLLIKKYKIKEPLNPLLNIIRLNYKTNDEPTEEIYFLLLILSYFFISPKIKEMNKIKNDFEKINIDEIIKNNILKRNIINKIIQNLSDLSMDSLLPNIWEKIKDCKKFTDDEEMNKLMVEYVENKSIEDFRNDLVNLIKPFYEEFNLTGKDQ